MWPSHSLREMHCCGFLHGPEEKAWCVESQKTQPCLFGLGWQTWDSTKGSLQGCEEPLASLVGILGLPGGASRSSRLAWAMVRTYLKQTKENKVRYLSCTRVTYQGVSTWWLRQEILESRSSRLVWASVGLPQGQRD